MLRKISVTVDLHSKQLLGFDVGAASEIGLVKSRRYRSCNSFFLHKLEETLENNDYEKL